MGSESKQGHSLLMLRVHRRDIPVVIAKGTHGATTVAGTMYAHARYRRRLRARPWAHGMLKHCLRLLAHQAGIEVFVTGGIGGVHREGHVSMGARVLACARARLSFARCPQPHCLACSDHPCVRQMCRRTWLSWGARRLR